MFNSLIVYCKHLILLGLLLCGLHLTSLSQDSLQSKLPKTTKPTKPEIFTSGFIDIMNNGQVNASARFIKLYIGEPGKISIPISFYGGVSNNTFQNQTTQLVKSNDHLVNQYINPMSGLINISIDNVNYFTKRKEKVTKCGFVYQFGERLLNGIRTGPVSDTRTGKQVNFLNSFAAGGFIFQTGAWEKTETKNVGVFWLSMRYHICHTGKKQIQEFLPDIRTNGTYTGYSLGFGIEINNVVSMKAIYYKYTKAPR